MILVYEANKVADEIYDSDTCIARTFCVTFVGRSGRRASLMVALNSARRGGPKTIFFCSVSSVFNLLL